jgi:hypothetical protein
MQMHRSLHGSHGSKGYRHNKEEDATVKEKEDKCSHGGLSPTPSILSTLFLKSEGDVKLPAHGAGLPGDDLLFNIVPLDPVHPAKTGRGTLRPKMKIRDLRSNSAQTQSPQG